MNYNIAQYREWLNQNVTLSNIYSPESLRTLTFHLLMGRNYRLTTEKTTKDRLLLTYLWLKGVMENAKEAYGDNWQLEVVNELIALPGRTQEQTNLLYWLIGLTAKTSVNLGVSKEDIPGVISDLYQHVERLLHAVEKTDEIDNAWLLMMAGSATLNIRGSDKSKVGKKLEKVFVRALLTILGLEMNRNFWMNIERDEEVDREADAEIESNRGRIRVEVGLIASGNQEVVEDKIARVGRNGIILFDKVGERSRIHQTAERHSVKLIQIRNNQPLVEVYRHIQPLVRIGLVSPPTTEELILAAVQNLSEDLFTF